MSGLLLNYLRKMPIDYGKGIVRKGVKLPETKEGVVYQNPAGVTFELNLNDHVMREIYLNGIYEKNTLRHLMKLTSPSATFVDVGANVGAYSLMMCKHLTQGQVFAFEPNPRTVKLLKRNIELNGFKNIEVVEKGLSDQQESATLYTPNLTTASINKNHESDEVETISLTTLDAFCNEKNLSSVDALKIDVEGHEMKCIAGASGIIEASKDLVLIVEIDDNCVKAGYQKEELFKIIMDKGFRAFVPKGYPFKMREITTMTKDYADNVIFIRETSSRLS